MDAIFEGSAVIGLDIGAWILLPTLRSILRTGYGPSWRNSQSVFYAEQSSHSWSPLGTWRFRESAEIIPEIKTEMDSVHISGCGKSRTISTPHVGAQ
jgi:hypothetical protein